MDNRFEFDLTKLIPKHRREDVGKLRERIIVEANIELSFVDTYLLWDAISTEYSAGWLDIDFVPSSESFAEFIEDRMHEFGRVSYT